jgi:hypothetical protein
VIGIFGQVWFFDPLNDLRALLKEDCAPLGALRWVPLLSSLQNGIWNRTFYGIFYFIVTDKDVTCKDQTLDLF